jgi:hypothetical protein
LNCFISLTQGPGFGPGLSIWKYLLTRIRAKSM